MRLHLDISHFFLILTNFYKQEKGFSWEKQMEEALQALTFLDNLKMWAYIKKKKIHEEKYLAFHNT